MRWTSRGGSVCRCAATVVRSAWLSVLDRVADLDEQAQPLGGGEPVLVAVIADLDAAHQFHDEVRAPRFGGAGVQHLGNVRMVHERQGLPLCLKACDHGLGVHAQFDDFQRHPTAHRFLLFGHVNHAATALADLLEEFVAADAIAGFFLRQRSGPGHRRGGHDALGSVVRGEQRSDAGVQCNITMTGTIEKYRALARWPGKGVGKYLLFRN